MHPIKYFWGLRALLGKLSFGHIGNLTYMGKPCFIEGRKNIRIGDRTRIFPGIRMEAIGKGKIEIGDNCAIEQNVHITADGSTLHIGNDVTILANTFITNIDHAYQDPDKSILQQRHIVSETRIEDGCFIGAGAAIQAGTKLGKHCVVGTNAVVRGNYPDGCVLVGVPARVIKRYDPATGEWKRVERNRPE